MSGSEKGYDDNPARMGGTGSPAEDREEERARKRLWNLKEEAKWGKDANAKRRAIEELSKSGSSAVTHLEEILLVLAPGELKQYCQDAINGIGRSIPKEGKNGAEKVLETKVEKSD
jgi:hypothetical protein